MGLGFAVAAAKIGAPIAKFLLKNYLGEAGAAVGAGFVDITAQHITDEEGQRLAARQFEDIGDKIVRRLLPLFEDIDPGAAEAVAHEIGLTLAGQVSAEFFIERDIEPTKLGRALRSARPLPKNTFTLAEISLYERALDEAIRYLVGTAQSLPKFEVQATASTLGRLSRIGGDIEKVLDGISRIERLVEQANISETSRRFEADYRQAVQINLDYLELFGADISPEAQRHSLNVGYVSLDLTSASDGKTTPTTHSATALFWLLATKRGRILIRGHAGSGKSTLLRWLAIETASGRLLSAPQILTHSARNLSKEIFISFKHDDPRVAKFKNTVRRPDIVFIDRCSNNRWTNTIESFIRTISPLEQHGKFSLDIADKLNSPVYLLDCKMPKGANWSKLLEEHLSVFESRIPFLIRLRDCSSGRLPTPDDLPSLIANEIGRPPVDWVRSVLGDGKGLLLLDGVDEVPNQQREAIRQGLEALIRRYPKNQYAVTTRPEAVPEGWLSSSGFSEASINPMSGPDRAEFIHRWHAAVSDELLRQGRPEDLSSLADELIAKLSESPAIARLATNPLLCAALCALHRDRHRKLPESQSELCEALCQLLLHRRETGFTFQNFPGNTET